MEKRKRRLKDRKDGYYVYDLDSMHKFMPYLLPNRADNEAVLNTRFDMTNAVEYLAKKNSVPQADGFKYTIFHLFVAAFAKTITMRPLLNRFIQGRRVYDRKFLAVTFVVKKQFTDGSHEALAILRLGENADKSPIEEVHDKIHDVVYDIRVKNKTDSTTGIIDKLTKLPRFLLKFVTWCLKTMDYLGWTPMSLIKDDPYFCTLFLSNLGSIKMDADYHHLANYGTNSIFSIIGEMKKRPFFSDDGTYEMKQSVDLGLTIDERIADGVYFAKSVKILKKLVENPELLDLPYDEEIDVGDVCGKPAFADKAQS